MIYVTVFYVLNRWPRSHKNCLRCVYYGCIVIVLYKKSWICCFNSHQLLFSVCVLAILLPSFFTVLYAMEWGREKSVDWLTTFLLSFFQSVAVVQPIKVRQCCLLRLTDCPIEVQLHISAWWKQDNTWTKADLSLIWFRIHLNIFAPRVAMARQWSLSNIGYVNGFLLDGAQARLHWYL